MTGRWQALRAGRFLLTGIANTAVGLAAVILARKIPGASEYSANLVGFAAGLACGFILNRWWTFQDRRKITVAVPRYLTAFVISYLVNLLLLTICLNALKLPHNIAQAASLITYSVTFFLLCHRFVFPALHSDPRDAQATAASAMCVPKMHARSRLRQKEPPRVRTADGKQ